MYLEHILILREGGEKVRAVDICRRTGYSKPSVSRALGLLREKRLIEVDGAGYITLTDEGEAIASRIYERHRILTEVFVRLGVPREVASEDACKIEHDISDETFAAIKSHWKDAD